MKKSQTSVELIIILAVSMIILLGIIQMSNDSMRSQNLLLETAKTTSFLEQVVSATELVYKQGYGAKTKEFLSMPEGIRNITIQDKTFAVEFHNGNTRYRTFSFDVTGSLPTQAGNYWIEFEAMSGFVIISTNTSSYNGHHSICGNNITEIGEECDGPDLQGKSCTDFGYDYGSLGCLPNCRFDLSGCSSYSVEICNDGIDNTGNGLIDCQDPSCIGQIGPGGGICCMDDSANCPGDDQTCKSCATNNECEFEGTDMLCNPGYLCSDAGIGGYGSGGRIPSQGYCDGYGSCSFASNTPSCTVQRGAPYEATGITICVDGNPACVDTCSDGIDNDGNGCVDGADYKCGGIETSCTDGFDNNCNGLVDCDDPDCAGFEGCILCSYRTTCQACVADRNCDWCEGGLFGSSCMERGDCKHMPTWQSCGGGKCFKNNCP